MAAPAAPTEDAFREALSRLFPEMQVVASRQLDRDALLDENESLFSGHRRLGGLEVSAAGPEGMRLGVNWQVLTPGLSDDEVARLVREHTAVDPPRTPPPAAPEEVLVADTDAMKTQVLRTDGRLLAVSWASNGTVVVASLSEPGADDGVPAAAARLVELGHELANLPDDGDGAEESSE